MNKIKYLGFFNLDPYLNMLIDEMLFNMAQEDKHIATLRFFKFSKPCISIGKNQDIKRLPLELISNGFEIIRRPTGGGAVLHKDDLCYSLVIPENYLGKNHSLLQSYDVIANGLKMGFNLCGLDVQYGTENSTSFSPLCFSTAMTYELTLNGKKLVGSAQRRAKGVLLQQGSIINEHNIPDNRLMECLIKGLKMALNVDYVYSVLSELF
ncbi:MAG: lipoate--protein ligase family protein [bacterium]